MDDKSFKTVPNTRITKDKDRFAVGEMIAGRYMVVEELGRGGMGIVYKCIDTIGKIPAALKALPPEISHNTSEMEDVRDNFAIVEQLNHPAIANIKHLEKDHATGDYYLIMECVEGKTLKQLLREERKNGGLPPEKILSYLRQTANALDYAHSRQIIHRDIKPGNIMVTGEDTVKILDFGLAAQIQNSLTHVSMAYDCSGTGPYMAPEQWRGKRQSAASDQYALAVMAYEMFSGRLPFENPDTAILKQAVLEEKADPVEGVSLHIRNALERAMSKDAASRFPSCSAFVDALEGKGDRGISAAAAAAAVPPAQEDSPSPAPSKKAGNRTKSIILIAAFVLLLTGIWLYDRYSSGTATKQTNSIEKQIRMENTTFAGNKNDPKVSCTQDTEDDEDEKDDEQEASAEENFARNRREHEKIRLEIQRRMEAARQRLKREGQRDRIPLPERARFRNQMENDLWPPQ